MKKFEVLFYIGLGLIVWALAININYPPSKEQLLIVNNVWQLWLLRMVCFMVVVGVLSWWRKFLRKVKGRVLAFSFVAVLAISPLLWLSWVAYPMLVLWLLVLTLGVSVLVGKSKYYLVSFLAVWVLGLIVVNSYFLNQDVRFLNDLSLKGGAEKVTEVFTRSDSLKEKIEVPLLIKRVSYNKFYLAFVDVMKNIVAFFDFDTWFFQEVHPLRQKSVIVFYWPELILFFVGLVQLFRIKKLFKVVLGSLGLAFLYYLLSAGFVYQRMYLILIPVGLVVALGLERTILSLSSENWVKKILSILVLVLLSLGYVNNVYDLSVRPDYWLDNRPIVNGKVFSEIKNKYRGRKIVVSDIFGDPRPYCEFYLEKCEEMGYGIGDYKEVEASTLMVGYAGEFFDVGLDDKEETLLSQRGLRYLGGFDVRDNIVNGYGQRVVFVEKNE